MGMLVGRLKIKSVKTTYQAIILSQAFDDIDDAYQHHIQDIRVFQQHAATP